MGILKDRRREVGDFGEEYASNYLQKKGYSIVGRNVRYRVGEIDIVAKYGKELHFIEVKTRKNIEFMPPLESITERQRGRIKRAAEAYLIDSKNHIKDHMQPICVFDVIGIDLTTPEPSIEFVEDAF
ncbi:MAG: YraN family protein [Deltaproteobacteria bacterium]|jgi:putative endonuclease|nr:YraN family protein [Deltaproteobacteria bacterium]